jgi:hypothetical protein
MLHASRRVHGREGAWALEAIHLTTLPFVTAWTWAFVTLHDEDMVHWNKVLRKQGMKQAGLGIALGTGAFLMVVAAAYVQGWVRFPAWGWERAPKIQLARTLLFHAVGHGAIAWNEEVVFRGYGLDSVFPAISLRRSAPRCAPLKQQAGFGMPAGGLKRIPGANCGRSRRKGDAWSNAISRSWPRTGRSTWRDQ